MSKAKKNNATTGSKTTNVGGIITGNDLGNTDTTDSNVEPTVKDYSKETHEAMKTYVAAYPDAKYFLIASDGQVFLPSNAQDAKVHQTHVDDKKELVKYSH